MAERHIPLNQHKSRLIRLGQTAQRLSSAGIARELLETKKLKGVEGLEYMRKALAIIPELDTEVPHLQVRLTKGTIPSLETKRANLADFIEKNESLLEAKELLDQAREKHTAGQLSQAVLANIEIQYNQLLASAGQKQTLLVLEEPVEVPAKEEALPAKADEKEQAEIPFPNLGVNLTTSTFELNGKNHRIPSHGIQGQLFMLFAKRANTPIGSKEIQEILNKAGGRQDSSQAIGFLRQILEEDPKTPKILVTLATPGRRSREYILRANVEFEGLFEIDFDKVPKLGKLERKLLEELRFASEQESADWKILGRNIYGYDKQPEEFRGALMALVGSARNKLKQADYVIKNARPERSPKGGLYYLEKIGTSVSEQAELEEVRATEEDKGLERLRANIAQLEKDVADGIMPKVELEAAKKLLAEKTGQTVTVTEPESSTDEEDLQVPAAPIRRLGIFEEGEMTEIPYEENSEEARSKEETKVLNAIVNGLTTHSRLWYDRLHREMAADLNEGVVSDTAGTRIRLYTARELYIIFASALDKMVEESKFEVLKSKWTVQEQTLWRNIEFKLTSWANNSIVSFKRKIDEELKRRENEYRSDHPGKDWISL